MFLYVTHLHKISRIAHFSENEIYDAIMFKKNKWPIYKAQTASDYLYSNISFQIRLSKITL